MITFAASAALCCPADQHFGSLFICQVLTNWVGVPGVDNVQPTLMMPQRSGDVAGDPVRDPAAAPHAVSVATHSRLLCCMS